MLKLRHAYPFVNPVPLYSFSAIWCEYVNCSICDMTHGHANTQAFHQLHMYGCLPGQRYGWKLSAFSFCRQVEQNFIWTSGLGSKMQQYLELGHLLGGRFLLLCWVLCDFCSSRIPVLHRSLNTVSRLHALVSRCWKTPHDCKSTWSGFLLCFSIIYSRGPQPPGCGLLESRLREKWASTQAREPPLAQVELCVRTQTPSAQAPDAPASGTSCVNTSILRSRTKLHLRVWKAHLRAVHTNGAVHKRVCLSPPPPGRHATKLERLGTTNS